MNSGYLRWGHSVSTILLLVLLCHGCAFDTWVTPAVSHSAPPLSGAESCVKLRELRFTGALAGPKVGKDPFMGGFFSQESDVKCTASSEYAEGTLTVLIDTDYSLSPTSYPAMVPFPVVPLFFLASGGNVNFNWRCAVNYELRDRNKRLIAHDTIPLKGKHRFQTPNPGANVAAWAFSGWGYYMHYPDEHAYKVFADEILTVAGQEVAKRLREEPARSYFAAQTKARDGMDLKTYAEFLRRDEQLRQDRERFADDRRKELQGTVEDESSTVRLGGTLVVLGIGVDQYANYPHLKYASRDCERVVSLFKTRYNLPDSHVLSLTDQGATAAKVKRFIEQDAAKLLKADDTFILYFGGHGAPDVDAASAKEDKMRKYILLSNSDPQTMPLSAVSLDDLAGLMQKLPCKRVLVFLDCCFAGTAGKDTLSRVRGLRISERTYKEMADISGRGRVVMAACSENQVSQESSALEAGMFTQALVEGLDGKADSDGSGRVDILELFSYATRRVGELTNGAQTPVFRGVLDRKIEF